MNRVVLIASLAAALAGTLQAAQAATASPLESTPVVCVTDGCTTDTTGKTGR